MTGPRFLVQRLDTGQYATPAPCVLPFTSDCFLAAAYGLEEAAHRATELGGGNPRGFRLVQAESFALSPA